MLKKCFKNKLNIFKCFIIFISFYFFVFAFIELLIKINTNININVKKIYFNNLNNASNITNTNSIIPVDNNNDRNKDNITDNKDINIDINNNKEDKEEEKTDQRTDEKKDEKTDNKKEDKTDQMKDQKTDEKIDKKTDEKTDGKKEEQTDEMKENQTDKKKEEQTDKMKEKQSDEKTDEKKEEEKYIDVIFDDRETSFKKASNFIDKCLKNVLINDKNNFEQISQEPPKVSAVIPVYNSKSLIHRCIRSIQNQDILNLEIILVNDYSTNDTLEYIETFQKEDPRIKIINNKKNMGTLYSRSIGALSAKGELIFPIDNDDLFLDKDVFSIVSNVAIKGKFDIVEFKGLQSFQRGNVINSKIEDTNWSNHKMNMVLTQPELGDYPIRSTQTMGNYRLFDVYLWNKCIRTKIYQKALNKLGEERYSRFMLAHEDVLAIFFLFNTAESYKFIGKYGIFHISHEGSAFGKTKPIEHDLKEFYLLDTVVHFSRNTDEHRKLIPNIILTVLGLKRLQDIVNMNNYKELLLSIIDKVLKSPDYSESLKNEVRKKGKRLKFLDYPF